MHLLIYPLVSLSEEGVTVSVSLIKLDTRWDGGISYSLAKNVYRQLNCYVERMTEKVAIFDPLRL